MARIKKKKHEKLTDSNISHVAELLQADKPITKKDACEILNISYNTSRLNNIIEDWKEKAALNKRKREENKGKPASVNEISAIIQYYLEGETITEIAKSIYRGVSFVKNIIESIGVPTRVIGEERLRTALLPERCIAEDFEDGEIAWSAVHNSPCVVLKQLEEKYAQKYSTNCYHIYIPESINEISPYFPHIERGGFNAYSASYDLGKLSHLKQYGVKTEKI